MLFRPGQRLISKTRLSRLSPLIILLIFLERQEITIFLPHSHMPSHLADVCDEWASILCSFATSVY